MQRIKFADDDTFMKEEQNNLNLKAQLWIDEGG